jgi:phosphatidylglycerophosphate synthase
MAQTTEGKKLTFTDWMRKNFKGLLDPIGNLLNRIGLMPNTITFLGLIGNTIGAIFLAIGNMFVGGLLILAMGPVDALDGTMARLRGEPTEFGAFVDSVTDRYSELIIFGGLLYYFADQGNLLGCILTFASAAGAVLVSYVRARAQSLGYDTRVGVLTRMERYLVLAPSLILYPLIPNMPIYGLVIIALFANVTALQRILDVRRQIHSKR